VYYVQGIYLQPEEIHIIVYKTYQTTTSVTISYKLH